MQVTPRRAEVSAVVALLESDRYATAETLAKDIIKKVAKLFEERDHTILAVKIDETLTVGYGPFASEAEAERWHKRCLTSEFPHRTYVLRPTADHAARHATCEGCGHLGEMHASETSKAAGACREKKCPCSKPVFTLQEGAICLTCKSHL